MDDLSEGDVFRVLYPFCRGEYNHAEEDGWRTSKTWRPGVEADYCGENIENYADAMGEMVLTVVSVHKPGRFPTRVFYTRQWVDPDGRPFGKGGCKIATSEKFKRLTRGFRFPFTVDPCREHDAD